MKIEHAWLFASFEFISTFFRPWIRKKNLIKNLGRYDIFIVYKNDNRQDITWLLPFMLKYENGMYVHGQPW